MLGPLDYLIWLLGPAVQAYVVVRTILSREFLRYLPLVFYMFSAALLDVGRLVVYRTYGLQSEAFLYFYYYSDTLLTVFLYFAILALYQRVFEEMQVSRHIRWAGALLLALTAIVSYTMVHQNAANMVNRFVVELSRNLYFVGVVLTYVLWGATLQLRETRTRIVQLVLSLGIFFSLSAALYAARNLFPGYAPWFAAMGPIAGFVLPLAWAYTFTLVPEEARLETAKIAAAYRSQVATAHR